MKIKFKFLNLYNFFLIYTSIFLSFPLISNAQKVGFIMSDVIREQFTESKQADQRIQSQVEDWKREITSMKKQIEETEIEIKKNRLIWSDEEKINKDKELEKLKLDLEVFAKQRFEPNGEYDKFVKIIMLKVEEKIYAAVQEVAANEGYDIVLDKSVHPLPYTNFKYDLTVKVLKKLGVNVEKLEKEQEEKISKDPRNEEKKSKEPPSKRSRTRDVNTIQPENASSTPNTIDVKPKNIDQQPSVNPDKGLPTDPAFPPKIPPAPKDSTKK